jgi:hypothetical protein
LEKQQFTGNKKMMICSHRQREREREKERKRERDEKEIL